MESYQAIIIRLKDARGLPLFRVNFINNLTIMKHPNGPILGLNNEDIYNRPLPDLYVYIYRFRIVIVYIH